MAQKFRIIERSHLGEVDYYAEFKSVSGWHPISLKYFKSQKETKDYIYKFATEPKTTVVEEIIIS